MEDKKKSNEDNEHCLSSSGDDSSSVRHPDSRLDHEGRSSYSAHITSVCDAINADALQRASSLPSGGEQSSLEKRREANRISARRRRKRRKEEIKYLDEERRRLETETQELVAEKTRLQGVLRNEISGSYADGSAHRAFVRQQDAKPAQQNYLLDLLLQRQVQQQQLLQQQQQQQQLHQHWDLLHQQHQLVHQVAGRELPVNPNTPWMSHTLPPLGNLNESSLPMRPWNFPSLPSEVLQQRQSLLSLMQVSHQELALSHSLQAQLGVAPAVSNSFSISNQSIGPQFAASINLGRSASEHATGPPLANRNRGEPCQRSDDSSSE